jgi:hypothetical protein
MTANTRSADAARLGAALSILKPEPALLDAWLGALRSNAFDFGAGLLRTADDEYDALGVLAAISLAEWEWVDVEGAWGIDGDAMTLKAQHVAEWLGVDEPDRLAVNGFLGHVESLISTVTDVADGATSHAQVLNLFEEARRWIESEKARLNGLRSDRFRSIRDPYEADLSARYRDQIVYRDGPRYLGKDPGW